MRPFSCYWEVDGPETAWPLDARDAPSAAQAFAAEHDLPEESDDPTAVCVVVPQESGGYGPSGPPERFRTYLAAGELRVERLADSPGAGAP